MRGRWLNRLKWATNGARANAFIYALLLAFVAQTIVTTSHFHGSGRADGTSIGNFDHTIRVVLQPASDAGSKHKSDDAAKCPICQAASLTSGFIGASYSIFLPVLDSFLVSHDERIIAVERFTAAWRSRAPPAL